MPHKVVYKYSDRLTRTTTTPSFQDKPDKQHTFPNYSIHPYRDEQGARQVYNTCKTRAKARVGTK